MRTCGRCKQSLSLDQFRFKNKEKTLYQGYCIECNKAKNKEHYRDNKQRYKDKARAYEVSCGGRQALRHHISPERLAEMYARFNGMCWNCKLLPAIFVDHDHSCCNDKNNYSCGLCVRGLLCRKCNTGLGLLGDSIEGLMQALEYLTVNKSSAIINLSR
jgi:hypothetical protein